MSADTDLNSGRYPSGRATHEPSPQAVLAVPVSAPNAGLPPELIAQLSAMPEEAPDDFSCGICGHVATNQWNHSTREYERPPICKSCESVTGFSWNGAAKCRSKPSGGSFRDRREAMRIGALADAIAQEATRQKWGHRYGRP